MNKSLFTNLLSLALIPLGLYGLPVSYGQHVAIVGLFAASGALTNWLAVHMLFEKVPLLYGSGVIPARFEEFKQAIHRLVMEQFFTHQNVERFMAEEGGSIEIPADVVAAAVDYDLVFKQFVRVIQESSFGGMLSMVGGVSALDPLREPLCKKMATMVGEIAQSKDFHKALSAGMGAPKTSDHIITKVENIVQGRLDELTPQMVKEIVQNMIRQHLGWLVVWGGVFGGLIGLLSSFLVN